MKVFRYTALAVLAFVASAANAQTLQQESLTASQAIAIVDTGAGGGGSGGGGTSRSRVHTTPSIIPPSFYGANPCSNSASGGTGWTGFGISFGGQWTEGECRAQEWFRFYHMAQQPDMAQAIACRGSAMVRQAAMDVGRPCPQDVQAAQQAAARAGANAPVVQQVAVQPTQPVPVQPANWRPADWCGSASGAETRTAAYHTNCVAPRRT